jgi:hypothetical protein
MKRSPTMFGAALRLSKALAAGAALAMWVSAAAAGPLAAGDPAVSFGSLAACVQPGALCTLQVFVDDAVDSLSCMEVYVAYDTAYAECTTALEGSLFALSGAPTFFRWQAVSPTTVTAVDCCLGYRTCFLAPGELVRFVFRGKKAGICRVSFSSVRLWDIMRVELAPVIGPYVDIGVCNPTGDETPPPRDGALFNYPNPFNPATRLILLLPSGPEGETAASVRVSIYTSGGGRVRSLYDGTMSAGRNELVWDGKNDRGRPVGSGIYFAVADTGRETFFRKLILAR